MENNSLITENCIMGPTANCGILMALTHPLSELPERTITSKILKLQAVPDVFALPKRVVYDISISMITSLYRRNVHESGHFI
jgi:hypothetical protein